MSSHSERLAALYHLKSGASTSRSTTARRQAKATRSKAAKATKSKAAKATKSKAAKATKSKAATAEEPATGRTPARGRGRGAPNLHAAIEGRRAAIEAALRDAGGNISEAARVLGTHRTQLRRWLDHLGIDPSHVEEDLDETWAKAIGAHVRRLRSAREDGGKSVGGVGQDRPEVARRLGVSTATLSRWEAEAPTLWLQLARLAALLGVTADELLNPPGLKGSTSPRPGSGPRGP